MAHGVRELPPGDGITYAAFCDPSGGSADSMTLAIGHCEANGVAVLDAVREVRPPFSPDRWSKEFSSLLKSYGISRVTWRLLRRRVAEGAVCHPWHLTRRFDT